MLLTQIRAGTAVLIPTILTTGEPPVLYDPPEPPVIYIQDPAGTIQVTAAAMTKVSTGNYSYIYTTSVDGVTGDWLVWIDATDSNDILSGSVPTPEFTLVV